MSVAVRNLADGTNRGFSLDCLEAPLSLVPTVGIELPSARRLNVGVRPRPASKEDSGRFSRFTGHPFGSRR
jgi:hypothetical protein